MLGSMEVFGGMFVLRGVATANVSAFQTEPQMDPGVSKFDALFANVDFGVPDLDLVEMSASGRP